MSPERGVNNIFIKDTVLMHGGFGPDKAPEVGFRKP
jgi:hypothetical protein